MITNLDPVGAVPEANADGRLLLNADRATRASAILPALMSTVLALASVGYLCARYVGKGLPPGWNGFAPMAFVGIFSMPLAIYWILSVLCPPQLMIDDEGLVYRARGRTIKFAWAALDHISLRQFYLPKQNAHKTQTTISGSNQKFNFFPVFGISPVDLAKYIAARQASSGNGVPVVVEGAASSSRDIKPNYIQRPDTQPTKPRPAAYGILTGIFAVLLVAVVVIAIVFAMLFYQAMRH